MDKYAPQSFLELLSDEAINRAVVKWLKSWDAAVFGTGREAAAASRAGGSGLAGGRDGKAAQDRRPAQRVLLMGGPPGLSVHRRPQCSLAASVRRNTAVTRSVSNPPTATFSTGCAEPIRSQCRPCKLSCVVRDLRMIGLGKTTLAHVVARHCGYRPVEINASDDRSPTALVQRVVDSAQMRTVTGDARPACLIIDEIDGAVGAPACASGREPR